MPYFSYDTSIIISRKLTDLQRMPQNFLMSAVVLMELIAGAEDRSIQKFWAGTFVIINGKICSSYPPLKIGFLQRESCIS